MNRVAATLLLSLAVTTMSAKAAIAQAGPTGFVSPAGSLSGKVTSPVGKALANVKVHVLSPSGAEQTVTTDAKGEYSVTTVAAGSFVYVDVKARIDGSVAAGEGVVEIRETLVPAKRPKPLSDPLRIPEYSDALEDRDTWARAWLLLDVSERGEVSRVKLINKPGWDLDPIAIRDALALTFEPARDGADKPMRALVLWTYEWPSPRWMEKMLYEDADKVPPEVSRVPCKMTSSKKSHHRDCSGPDLANAIKQPWVEKPRPAKK